MAGPLWQPSAQRVAQSNLHRFAAAARERHGVEAADYRTLHRWSVDHAPDFWSLLWDFAGVVAERKGDVVLADAERMPGARWFPEARLNFAENLLRRRDEATAMVFRGEDRVERTLTFAQVHAEVSRLAGALRAAGIGVGDRVAGYVPNGPEAAIAMLAAASIGAIWSSCSPDFGVRGVVDRFGQIAPRVLVSADGYFYNGKRHDSIARLAEIRAAIPSIEHVVVFPYTTDAPDVRAVPGGVTWGDFVAAHPAGEIAFEQLPFDHPLFIMYSSGTTGVPKCIVHGAGGTLLQHLKEHQLHTDLRADDRLFYFTTCGWMMWNWLVSGLATGATLLLYDGSPFHPSGNVLFDFADAHRMTVFGTSAKYIDAVKKAGLEPRRTHDLGSVRAMLSTGSPLVPESFDFVYQSVKEDICLSSISGGTDIISCFALGNPTLPVYRGELQCLGLGLDVAAFDDEGAAVIGEKGELVCRNPFPCMPVGFWNDDDGARYRAAYFEKFPGVWCHGDYVEIRAHAGHDGMMIFGRSDAVLNPGGVRIGTAEIYRQVEQLEEVVEGLVIGQDHEGDVRVVLFVVLRAGLTLDDALRDRIRRQIRANTTPRHVPARIVQVPDIPRTKSGKITELAVRDVVHGRAVKNKEALANPEALEHFRDRPELAG
ncbi:MAG: acetoacetate--CoA ligase [Ectothiorhodospiraceae bacterium]|nr:acetoacetate--CoA ligase [Ectothiorhodospiraceae bacterium]